MHNKPIWLAFTITLIILLTQIGQANAAIYKCVSADGETSFSETACPLDSDASEYSISGSSVKKNHSMDCRLAQKFAESAGQAMRDGASSGRIFNRYGGLSSMSGPAVSIVNYVYTFEHNYKATVERIGGLAGIRCENGSFGDTSCANFPSRFVSEAGGCDLSKIDVNGSESGPDGDRPAAAYGGTSREDYLIEEAKLQCKTAVLKKLETIDNKSRAGLTAKELDIYRAQRKILRTEFNNC